VTDVILIAAIIVFFAGAAGTVQALTRVTASVEEEPGAEDERGAAGSEPDESESPAGVGRPL
jgi:hypothetical protein